MTRDFNFDSKKNILPDCLTLVIFLVKPLPHLGAGVEVDAAGVFPEVEKSASRIQGEEILGVEY